MPDVVKERYLRIQASHDQWHVGMERSVGQGLNKLARDWRQNSNNIMHPATGKKAYANIVLVDFQHALVERAKKQRGATVAVDVVLSNLGGQLKAIHDVLLSLREYVFEDIRHKEFSDRPSRQTCLYLCPDRSECVKYWWDTLKSQGESVRRIWEVESTGKTFLAPDLVVLETRSVEDWESLARTYWSPHPTESPSDEILFTGDIEVVAERDKAEFGIS